MKSTKSSGPSLPNPRKGASVGPNTKFGGGATKYGNDNNGKPKVADTKPAKKPNP